jgi:hypothetical protein
MKSTVLMSDKNTNTDLTNTQRVRWANTPNPEDDVLISPIHLNTEPILHGHKWRMGQITSPIF